MPTASPIACLAAVLLISGSAAAQPTPETPGAAGAEAAVEALVAAQQAHDFSAAFALIDPEIVSGVAEEVRGTRTLFERAVADSASTVAQEGYRDRPRPAAFGAFRRAAARLDSLAFYGDPSDAEIAGRLVGAATALDRTVVYPESRYELVRTDVQGDSLAHVVGRLDSLPGSSIAETVETTAARWTGTRWAVTFGSMDQSPITDFVRFPAFNMAEILNAALGGLFEGLDL